MGNPRILVVEDDAAIRRLLVTALSRGEIEVDSVGDGVAALDQVRVQQYAVIILDLMLPRLNGVEFLQAFRRAQPAARTVVVAMTAFDATTARQLTAESVHAIIHKPFDIETVVAVVREAARVYATSGGEFANTGHDEGPPAAGATGPGPRWQA